MQANEQHTGIMRWLSVKMWLLARWPAVLFAWLLYHLKLHKQIVNRIIEPWSHITVIATTGHSGLMNFFALRAHPDAQPEFQVLAYAMLEAYLHASSESIAPGEWYIPMWNHTDDQSIVAGDWAALNNAHEFKVRVACGRIARVSYLTHDGRSSKEEDAGLANRLLSSRPIHASPFESVAKAALPDEVGKLNGNLPPQWVQYRKTLPHESTASIDHTDLWKQRKNAPNWVKALLNSSGVRLSKSLEAVTNYIQ
jgi:hypothetical protein